MSPSLVSVISGIDEETPLMDSRLFYHWLSCVSRTRLMFGDTILFSRFSSLVIQMNISFSSGSNAEMSLKPFWLFFGLFLFNFFCFFWQTLTKNIEFLTFCIEYYLCLYVPPPLLPMWLSRREMFHSTQEIHQSWSLEIKVLMITVIIIFPKCV